MWWLKKSKRKEIWDEDIQWPMGDIKAANKIRDICRSAADSAEKLVSGMRLALESGTTWVPPVEYMKRNVAATVANILLSHDLAR